MASYNVFVMLFCLAENAPAPPPKDSFQNVRKSHDAAAQSETLMKKALSIQNSEDREEHAFGIFRQTLAKLKEKDAKLKEKDAKLKEKDEELEEMVAKLNKYDKMSYVQNHTIKQLTDQQVALARELAHVMTRSMIEHLEEVALKGVPKFDLRAEEYKRIFNEREYKWLFRLNEEFSKTEGERNLFFEIIFNEMKKYNITKEHFAFGMAQVYNDLCREMHTLRLKNLPFEIPLQTTKLKAPVVNIILELYKKVDIVINKKD